MSAGGNSGRFGDTDYSGGVPLRNQVQNKFFPFSKAPGNIVSSRTANGIQNGARSYRANVLGGENKRSTAKLNDPKISGPSAAMLSAKLPIMAGTVGGIAGNPNNLPPYTDKQGYIPTMGFYIRDDYPQYTGKDWDSPYWAPVGNKVPGYNVYGEDNIAAAQELMDMGERVMGNLSRQTQGLPIDSDALRTNGERSMKAATSMMQLQNKAKEFEDNASSIYNRTKHEKGVQEAFRQMEEARADKPGLELGRTPQELGFNSGYEQAMALAFPNGNTSLLDYGDNSAIGSIGSQNEDTGFSGFNKNGRLAEAGAELAPESSGLKGRGFSEPGSAIGAVGAGPNETATSEPSGNGSYGYQGFTMDSPTERLTRAEAEATLRRNIPDFDQLDPTERFSLINQAMQANRQERRAGRRIDRNERRIERANHMLETPPSINYPEGTQGYNVRQAALARAENTKARAEGRIADNQQRLGLTEQALRNLTGYGTNPGTTGAGTQTEASTVSSANGLRPAAAATPGTTGQAAGVVNANNPYLISGPVTYADLAARSIASGENKDLWESQAWKDYIAGYGGQITEDNSFDVIRNMPDELFYLFATDPYLFENIYANEYIRDENGNAIPINIKESRENYDQWHNYKQGIDIPGALAKGDFQTYLDAIGYGTDASAGAGRYYSGYDLNNMSYNGNMPTAVYIPDEDYAQMTPQLTNVLNTDVSDYGGLSPELQAQILAEYLGLIDATAYSSANGDLEPLSYLSYGDNGLITDTSLDALSLENYLNRAGRYL